MAAIYAGQWSGGDTTGTSDRSASGTPAAGELLVVFCAVSVNTNAAPTCSDDQGGLYYLAGTRTWNTSANTISMFVRTKPVESAVAHNVTVATGANDAGVVAVIRVSGMHRFGLSAVVQTGGADNGASSGTPAFTFGASVTTTNVTVVAVGSGDTTTTPPASWTERIEANQATPTTACEVATRDSGFTGTTVTWGATQSATWAAIGIELNVSALTFAGVYPTSAGILNSAVSGGTWDADWLMAEGSGSLVPAFGTGSFAKTAGTPTYAQTDFVGGSTAVLIEENTVFDAGDIYDMSSGDMCVLVVFKLHGTRYAGADICGKYGSNTGWRLDDNGSAVQFHVHQASSTPDASTTALSVATDDWAVALLSFDNTGNEITIALWTASAGYRKSVVGASGTYSGTGALKIGKIIKGQAAPGYVDFMAVGRVITGIDGTEVDSLYTFVEYMRTAPVSATTNNLLLMGVG